jgi:POT family proton-dependent oligopeptide transporter
MVFVLVEMWELFCFYGMWGTRHFMDKAGLALSDRDANFKYGAIQALWSCIYIL